MVDPTDVLALRRQLPALVAAGESLQATNAYLQELNEGIWAVKDDTAELPEMHDTMRVTAEHTEAMGDLRSLMERMSGEMAKLSSLAEGMDPEQLQRLPDTVETLTEQLQRLTRVVEQLGGHTERLAEATEPLRQLSERFG